MGAPCGLGKAPKPPVVSCGMRTCLLCRGFARWFGAGGRGGEGEEKVGGEEKPGGGGDGHERAHRGVWRRGLGRFARPDTTDAVREACGAEALADAAGEGADLGLREVAHAQGGGIEFAGGAHGGPSGESAAKAVGEEGDFGGEVVDGVDHGIRMGAVEELGKVVVGYAEAFGGGAAGSAGVSGRISAPTDANAAVSHCRGALYMRPNRTAGTTGPAIHAPRRHLMQRKTHTPSCGRGVRFAYFFLCRLSLTFSQRVRLRSTGTLARTASIICCFWQSMAASPPETWL